MKSLRYWSAFICSMVAFQAAGQQQSLYSQYLFNLYIINPAYAGHSDALSTNVGYRAQWIGIEGAPVTQHLTLSSPLTMPNMAAGFVFQNDEIGARKAPSASFTYVYVVRVGNHDKVRFGLQGGIMNYQVNFSELEYAEPNDPVALSIDGNRWIGTFDFGVMYTAPRSYIGISAYSLNEASVNFTSNSDARLSNAFNFIAGKIFTVSDFLSVKGSTLVRFTEGAPVQFDLNLGMLLVNKVWITNSYRYDFGIITSLHCYISERIHFGYSFDWAMNNLADYQNGTHEIFLGFDLNIYKSSINSPKYY